MHADDFKNFKETVEVQLGDLVGVPIILEQKTKWSFEYVFNPYRDLGIFKSICASAYVSCVFHLDPDKLELSAHVDLLWKHVRGQNHRTHIKKFIKSLK